MTLDTAVRMLAARVLPARIASEFADDVMAEYRRVRGSRGRGAAALLLARESASLVLTIAGATIRHTLASLIVLRRDLSYVVRALLRRPWTSVSAVLMMSAGLSAIAASIGLASALLFRPISTSYPDEVRRLAAASDVGRPRLAFSEVELAAVREHIGDAATLAVSNLQPIVLRIGDGDIHTLIEVTGGRYFDLLGLPMAAGRPLIDADAVPGAPPVAVISDAIWRDHFARSADAVGSDVRVNGRTFTVVGVTRGTSTSSLLGGSVDVWIAVAQADTVLDRSWRTNPDNRWWTTILRVDARALPQLEAALTRATTDLAARQPDPWRRQKLVTVAGSVVVGRQRDAAVALALVVTAFAVLILAAAAANVSGLLLARAAADRGRAAIHLAIGSGRLTIVRRQLMEGALLGAAAGAAALAVYLWIARQLQQVVLLPTLSLRLDLPFDARTIGITIAAGIAAGLLLAIGPALWTTSLDVAETLRDGAGRASGGASISRSRRWLVGAQVAISITVLTGATLFARSLDTLSTLDIGFPRQGLLAFDFDLEPSTPPLEMLPGLAREALDRVAAVPGVTAAAMSNRAPIDSSTPAVAVTTPGSTLARLDDVTFYLATERYFDTVGLPIVRGRAFTAAEAAREADVAVVNQTLAAALWPDGDALERALVLLPEGRTVRVVGIATDSKYRSLSEASRPHFYLPAAPNFSRALLVRTQDDPRRAMRAVQQVLDRVGPGIVGFFPRTLDDHLAIDMLATRASARVAGWLAVLALLLSGAGLYGIVSWFVEVRRREIGVRLALGAPARAVRALVVREAASAAAPGVAIGLAMAMALTVLGRSLFVGVGAIDLVSLLISATVLIGTVVVASYVPSRRATRVDPLTALRES